MFTLSRGRVRAASDHLSRLFDIGPGCTLSRIPCSPRHQFIDTSADASRLYRNDKSPAILTRCLARVVGVFCLSPAYLLVELQFLRYSRLDSANM